MKRVYYACLPLMERYIQLPLEMGTQPPVQAISVFNFIPTLTVLKWAYTSLSPEVHYECLKNSEHPRALCYKSLYQYTQRCRVSTWRKMRKTSEYHSHLSIPHAKGEKEQVQRKKSMKDATLMVGTLFMLGLGTRTTSSDCITSLLNKIQKGTGSEWSLSVNLMLLRHGQEC